MQGRGGEERGGKGRGEEGRGGNIPYKLINHYGQL